MITVLARVSDETLALIVSVSCSGYAGCIVGARLLKTRVLQDRC